MCWQRSVPLTSRPDRHMNAGDPSYKMRTHEGRGMVIWYPWDRECLTFTREQQISNSPWIWNRELQIMHNRCCNQYNFKKPTISNDTPCRFDILVVGSTWGKERPTSPLEIIPRHSSDGSKEHVSFHYSSCELAKSAHENSWQPIRSH